MPSVEENQRHWSSYDWSQEGDEWSAVWGGTPYLWWGSVYPRILGQLPTGTILEIAPGYGRFTRYLKDYCSELMVVDLVESCIDACRQRFRDESHIRYFVNDGRSLDMIPSGSVDFAFSFDSLVHAEADVIGSYISDLADVLAPRGTAFLHHSNLADLRDPVSGELPFENRHWRAESVSASLVAEISREAGLHCSAQELVNWGERSDLTDCFSVLEWRDQAPDEPPDVRENPGFMAEALGLGAVSRLYASPGRP